MIASRSTLQPRFLPKTVSGGMYFCLLMPFLAGCIAESETTLLRASRAREVGEVRAERKQQERELNLWQATRDESTRLMAQARLESVRTSSRLRTVKVQLRRQMDALQALEKELLLAKKRAEDIEQQLVPLRGLEQQMKDQDRLITTAAARIKVRAGEVARATEGAAKQEAQLKPRLDALVARLKELKAAGVLIADVEAKIAAAQKIMAPPKATPAKKK
jgi:hypothetical protein